MPNETNPIKICIRSDGGVYSLESPENVIVEIREYDDTAWSDEDVILVDEEGEKYVVSYSLTRI